MLGQAIADGVLTGAVLALGAIGVSLSLQILRFANFSHSELVTSGAYLALALVSAFGTGTALDPFSFGWTFVAALALAALATGGIALLVDRLVFQPLRARRAQALTMVFASFGLALVLRSLVLLIWGPDAYYYSSELQFAVEVLPDVRLMPDQIFVLGFTIATVVVLHLAIKRTRFGIALRAMAESPELARISGIETQSMLRWTWLIAGALAAAAGVFSGLTVQMRPEMGFNVLLALFTAAILGGHGSLWGAVVGGLAIGLAENLSVMIIPSSYKPAVPFLLLILVLFFRPQGLFAPARSAGR